MEGTFYTFCDQIRDYHRFLYEKYIPFDYIKVSLSYDDTDWLICEESAQFLLSLCESQFVRYNRARIYLDQEGETTIEPVGGLMKPYIKELLKTTLDIHGHSFGVDLSGIELPETEIDLYLDRFKLKGYKTIKNPSRN